MHFVRQKHKLGCASASLAMVLGISYEEALAQVHPNRKKGAKVCTNILKVCDVFLCNGFDIELIQFDGLGAKEAAEGQRKLMSDKRPGVLNVYMPPYIPWRHACAWDGERVLDPMTRKGLGSDELYFDNLVNAVLVRKR